MKRNDIPILIGTAAFSFLFYNQSEGVNYFLFNILLVFLLLIRDRELIRSKGFLMAAGGAIVSSFFIFWYDTTLPFTADIISLVLLAGVCADRESSFIIACFHSLYSLFGVGIFLLVDAINEVNRTDGNKGRGIVFNKVMLGIIPFIVFLVFFFIYRSSNPIFDQLASKINFDFISVLWCLFTVWGFLLMYGFFKQRAILNIQRIDHDTPDELAPISVEEHSRTGIGGLLSVPNLVYTGVLLLVLLNLLLAVVNGLDVLYLMILHATPPGITFSQYLHNGTNSLIASIILAVSVILFYFKGYLNFYEKNKWLKNLAYVWIAQNIVLVLSTAYRNTAYINDYGLTHKRIGVYVYLFLCIAGLVTTFFKIEKGKNNWFLFRKNAWIVYCFMIVCCPFDWDSIITDFDIRRFQSNRTMEIDQRYLADLGHTNMAVLFHYYIVEGKTLHAQADTTHEEIISRSNISTDQYTQDIKNTIWYRYLNMELDYAPHRWQSHCMSKSNNLHAVERMIKENNLICPVSLR